MSSGKPETRAAILEAARRMIEERGAAAVRLADVAQAAGVTRQGLYLHFGSRTGLLLAVVEYVDRSEELGRWADAVWEAPDGIAALDRFVELHGAYTPRIYAMARVLLSGRHSDEAVAAAWEDRMSGRWTACRRIVRWLVRDGILDPIWDENDAADTLWTLTSIQVWEQLVRDKAWPQARYEAHLKTLLHRSLLRPSHPD